MHGAIERYERVMQEIERLERPSDKMQKILARSYILRGNSHQLMRNFSPMRSDYHRGKAIDPESIRYLRQEKWWESK